YFYLLSGRLQDAEKHLDTAWADNKLKCHFEVGLSRARVAILRENHWKATTLLRSLTSAFFASALRTLVPPIFEPDADSNKTDRDQFATALADGNVGKLEKLLLDKLGARSPNAARTRSNA